MAEDDIDTKLKKALLAKEQAKAGMMGGCALITAGLFLIPAAVVLIIIVASLFG